MDEIRQFCNFLLMANLGICMYLMVFEGFAAPEIPTLGDALLRFLAALCLQLLTLRLGRKEILRFAPLSAAFLIAVWGFFLLLTSPSWRHATFGGFLADYVSPAAMCWTVWGIHRRYYP